MFGALEFRGGLELSSSDPKFGGISALHIQPDGKHFLALSDRAYWLRGRIVYEGTRPAAISDAEIAPVLGPGKGNTGWDTESIADSGGRLYLGVERLDRIPYFDYNPSELPVYRDALPFPPGVEELPRNLGLEALVFVPKEKSPGGRLIAFSEKGLDKDGNMKAYIIEGTAREVFAVKRNGEYDISDAVLLPDGDILLLERKYEVVNGVSVRLRRIAVDSIRPGAVVDGPVVFEADMRCHIDNLEAIAVHRDASGEIILTMMSDDNYSTLQRSLLLQFVLRK